VIWDAPNPDQMKIVPGTDKEVCAKDKVALEEDFLINPKNKGLKNVFVWIAPTGAAKGAPFPVKDIHPDLLKPAKAEVEIDQPCCRFIPHVLAAREGQKLVIKNTAPIAHNGKWSSKDNGEMNPLIPSGGQFVLPKALVAETSEISLSCSIHSWMKAHVRVFDHPYFAITDEEGNFEIPNAPVGKYSVFVHHPSTGWLDGVKGRAGNPIVTQAGANQLQPFKMKPSS